MKITTRSAGDDERQDMTGQEQLTCLNQHQICVSDDSFPCNRITLFNAMLSDVVLTDKYVLEQWQRHLRSWRRWAQSPHMLLQPFVLGTVGGNRWLQHVQQVEDCEPESEFDSDEISEDEDDYER